MDVFYFEIYRKNFEDLDRDGKKEIVKDIGGYIFINAFVKRDIETEEFFQGILKEERREIVKLN